MRGLLDDERLDGSSEVELTYRPARFAAPVLQSDMDVVMKTIAYECARWGGAQAPLIPIDQHGVVPDLYARILPGSAVDGLYGGSLAPRAKVTRPRESDLKDRHAYGVQLAVALLEPRRRDEYRILEVVELEKSDAWRPIYAACLGSLDERPPANILKAGWLQPDLKYEDFLHVNRVSASGSLDDLLERLEGEALTPRKVSMLELAYGTSGSGSLRSAQRVLPDSRFAGWDAGPNVVVVCSPDSVDDVALLWNLRGALGDSYPLPIGLPAAEATNETVTRLARHPHIPRNGSPVRNAYITSVSISVEELRSQIGAPDDHAGYDIVDPSEILTFGPAGGWTRSEVVVWRDGESRFVPLPADSNRDLFERRAMSDITRMHVDLRVPDKPFPMSLDVRVDAPNSAFYGGAQSHWIGLRNRSQATSTFWPSSLVTARALARARGLDLAESEPGRAGLTALNRMSDLGYVANLAHAPLLALLEEMAARQGFGWYKQRMRDAGQSAHPLDAVGPTSDELPERSYSDFKRVLGNSEPATKQWLYWAEQVNLIVKGFSLQCDRCEAKQWIPINAFAPPIVCRGCGRAMEAPFGNRPNADFKYRVSERLRRVFGNDSMGHLLALDYLSSVLGGTRGGRLIGGHPGMEVRVDGNESAVGEADVLLLTTTGEFVPAEVKRSASGFTNQEIAKLDRLAETLNAPWSAVIACGYARDSDSDIAVYEQRFIAHREYRRIALSYDHILDPHPFWALGADPFAPRRLSDDEIREREQDFVARLVTQGNRDGLDWHSQEMLRRSASEKVSADEGS